MTTNYLVDTNNHTGYAQVVEEIVGGAVTKQFTFGHDLILQRIGANISFYQYDGHGSVRQLTDASGAITDTYTYDAFGILIARTGSTPNDYLYAGEQFDANLGFYYLRARYLNPSSGRFQSIDEYEGNKYEPLSLHKYLYANGDPVKFADPSGRYSIAETAGVSLSLGTLAAMAVLSLAAVCSIQYSLSTALGGSGVDTSTIPGPCINRQNQEPNKMRVQLQAGDIHYDSEVATASPQRGVTVVQMERALEIMFHRAKMLIPNRFESDFLGAVARTSIGLRLFPPAGVIQGGNVWRETFSTYRVDTENLRGHNLKEFY